MAIAPARSRRPAVAGYFYPEAPQALAGLVDRFCASQATAEPATAVVVPHGSYVHAGAVAGEVFGRVHVPRRCLVIGPSHTGTWMPWSLMSTGAYRTPLGEVPVDEALAEALRARCPFLEPDAWAQRGEHAVEVVVPFLQRRGPADLRIVPVIVGAPAPDDVGRFGEALAQVIRLVEEPVLLVLSSDLAHYEPLATVETQDRALLEAIEGLDAQRLLSAVQAHGVNMCGDLVVAAGLRAARALGARAGRCVAHATSAAGGGDPDSATGYGGVVCS